MKSKCSTPTNSMLYLLLIVSLLAPSWALAAITEVGTPTLGSDTVGGASVSVARTTTSGSKGLTVQLSWYNGSGAVAAPTLSWNGTAMTTACEATNTLGGNDKRSAVYFLANPAAGSFNLTGTFSNTVSWRLAIREWSNGDNYHDCSTANGDSGTPSVNVANVVSGEVTLDAVVGNTTLAVGSGQSTTNSYNGNLVGSIDGGASIDTASTGTVAMDWTATASTWAISAFALTEAPAFSTEQEGFRWGVDDGSESAHGWEAAQDTSVTLDDNQSRLIRLLVNGAGNPDSIAYALRYQKNGSGGYTAVPVGSSTTTSPPAAPTGTGTTVGTASASWSITRPTASSGDLVVFVLAWDDSTDATSVTAPAGPNSETAVSIAGPQASASTEMRIQAWYYVATGAWSGGTSAWTPSASETVRAVTFVVPAGQFNSSDPIGWSNTAASAGTTESNVNSPTGTTESNDGSGRIYIAFGSDADALTAPGSNWNTIDNATGGGVGLLVGSRNTLASNSESVTALTATITSDSWATLAFVVKPSVVTHEVYITTSANITAGGEATTARLTAPSGKTTGDFVTGRRWDDENGTDTIDITTDDYTEVEWLVFIDSSASPSDYYDFRAYNGGSALTTYTVTPRWTITPAGGSVVRGLMLLGVGQ